MGELDVMIKFDADRAINLSIKNAHKKFIKEVKGACKAGLFSVTFRCSSLGELKIYEILADEMGYKYDKDWHEDIGWIEVMW